MLGSIAAVTLVGTMLLAASIAPPVLGVTQGTPGSFAKEGEHILVTINSPFGEEDLQTFKAIQISNMMGEHDYYTIRLDGPIMSDKVTLLHWIQNDKDRVTAGQTATKIDNYKPLDPVMTKPNGEKMGVPITGKVTVQITYSQKIIHPDILRQYDFSSCHVAAYKVFTLFENEKKYTAKDNVQIGETVVFACKNLDSMTDFPAMKSRLAPEKGYFGNNNRKEIINENGELIITSREYRQPIIMEDHIQTETKQVEQEIVTKIALDRMRYETDDAAKFTVTFTDLEGNNVEPDTMRALYDGKLIQLEKQDLGVYTFKTPALTKAHHQLIVSAEKTGFGTDTAYLSIPVHRIS